VRRAAVHEDALIATAALTAVGSDLQRPECVLCTADGSLYVSDWGGGVCHIAADGTQTRILAKNPPCELLPNGIALQADGSFLLANLGDAGGIWRLKRDGSVAPFIHSIDGVAMPPTNFVLPDNAGRVWATVSTTVTPRALAYRPDTRDGYIVVHDKRGARIAADGLGYTNEVQLHPNGEWLYVNETFARRTSRFRVSSNGTLGKRETVTEYGEGIYPDGLCFDANGAFWVVSIVSNRVLRVTADLQQQLIVDDADAGHVHWVEQAFLGGTMGRPHLDLASGKRLRNVSSIAFGGPDRRRSYLGCLSGEALMQFSSPFAGVEPVHWNW
jgi:sugar lactone lactonase YvrE